MLVAEARLSEQDTRKGFGDLWIAYDSLRHGCSYLICLSTYST